MNVFSKFKLLIKRLKEEEARKGKYHNLQTKQNADKIFVEMLEENN